MYVPSVTVLSSPTGLQQRGGVGAVPVHCGSSFPGTRGAEPRAPQDHYLHSAQLHVRLPRVERAHGRVSHAQYCMYSYHS